MSITQQNQRRKKLLENEAKSFKEYVANNGKDARKSELEARADAGAEALRSSTDHGAIAESLAGSGLSGSGYEDYMRSRVELSQQARLDAARHEAELTKLENRKGYARYLSEHDALQTKLSDALIEELSVEAVPDYEAMLDRAIAAGLTEERAAYTASSAYGKASDNAVYRAIAFAKNNSLTAYRAKKYALSIGLSEELADRVYDAIFVLAENSEEKYKTLSADEYNEYIKHRAEANEQYKLGKELSK